MQPESIESRLKGLASSYGNKTPIPGNVPLDEFVQSATDPVVLRILWEAGVRPTTPFLREVFAGFDQVGHFVDKMITLDYEGVRQAIAAGYDVNTPLPGSVPTINFAIPAMDPLMLRILWEGGAKATNPWLEELFADFARGGDGSTLLKPKLAEVGRLILHRFCGDEEFAICTATMHTIREGKKSRLCFRIETQGVCLKSLPDTAELKARPNAEVTVSVGSAKELAAKCLVGKSFSVPCGYDDAIEDHVAVIYYADHADLDDNEIKILSKKGSKYLVQWTGTTMDVNHYDGSKPKTRVEIEATFTMEKRA
jgi:hypothetical protein